MEKLFIKNRNNKNLSVVIDRPENSIGLALVMHGLGGYKEQPHIAAWSNVFVKHGYISIRFDAANTVGESEGSYELATVTNYYEDLEDVINWAKTQEFYNEPFYLVGHSLGGICTALYAENYPEQVKGLVPVSTVVSGELSMQSYDKTEVEDWKETGWKIRVSQSKPGVIKKLPWSHMIDRLHYDLLKGVEKLTMPVLIMVGSEDDVTPADHQKILFDVLPGIKEFHLIPGAPHTFREESHIEATSGVLDKWIDS